MSRKFGTVMKCAFLEQVLSMQLQGAHDAEACMFDRLRRLMRGEQSDGGETRLSEDELRAAYRQSALKYLHDEHGIMPIYRPDIESTEDYDARMTEMPPVVIWNERRTPTGVSYSIAVSPFLVWCAFRQYMAEKDPWLDEECARLHEDLKRLTESSMNKTIEKTGMMPSQICAQV